MDLKNEEHLSTIHRYKRWIDERDKDLEKAAIIGNQLLVDKKLLEEKVEDLQRENECLKQKNYSLELALETQSKTLAHQVSEVSEQAQEFKDLLEKYEVQQRASATLKQTISNLNHEVNDQEEVRKENAALRMKLAHQKDRIREMRQRAESSLNATVIEAEMEETDVENYKLRISEKQECIVAYQIELQNSKMEENRLTDLVKELEEAISEKDKTIKSCFSQIQKAKEECSELQCEVEMLKLQHVDVNRKGNSMFGELDDRRIKVENHYKILEKKYQTVCQNFENSKKELSNCKGQLSILLSMTSRAHQEAYIKKLESQVSDARQKINDLTASLNKAVKMQKHHQSEPAPLKHGDEYNYLKVMHQQEQAKVKELEDEVINLRLLNMSNSECKGDTQRWLYLLQEENDNLKLENIKLMNQVKHFTLKPDQEAPPVDEPRVEVLPGYSPTPQEIERVKENALNKTLGIVEVDDDIIPGEYLMEDGNFRQTRAPSRSNKSILREFNTVKDKEPNNARANASKHNKSSVDYSRLHSPKESELCISPKVEYKPLGRNKRDQQCHQQ